MSATFDFTVHDHPPDGQVFIDLRGGVDVFNAASLRDELSRLVSEGSLNFVLDVKRLDFIDVTGLAVIIAAAKRIGDAGGHVTLRAPTKAVQRIVDLTKRRHFLTFD